MIPDRPSTGLELRSLRTIFRPTSHVTANVVWYAVKRCACEAGIVNLAPHDLRRTCARLRHGCGGELEQIQKRSAKKGAVSTLRNRVAPAKHVPDRLLRIRDIFFIP
jgi:integrase